MNGKLCHAAMAMPWANGLFHLINTALAKHCTIHRLNATSRLALALDDFRTIIALVEEKPMPLAQLIPAKPDIIGRVDASKLGAGGI